MKLFKDLRAMLTDGDSDKISSKRLITFLSFVIASIAFFGNLFFNLTVDDNMFDGFIQIVWAGLGVVVGEKLLKARNSNKAPKPNEEQVEVPNNELGDN